MLPAALLPENLIMEGWFYVASQSPDNQNSERFRRCMLSQWIKEDFIKVLCVFGETHRTTNFLEGWHHKLNPAISKKNPSLMKLLLFCMKTLCFMKAVLMKITVGTRDHKEANKKTSSS